MAQQVQDDPVKGPTPQRWTAKRKAAVCMEILKGKTTAAEVARMHGLTVADVEGWLRRKPLESEERAARYAVVARIEPDVRAESGMIPGIEGSKREEAAVQRTAVSRALVQRGLLTIRRRRFTPSIKRSLWSKIT